MVAAQTKTNPNATHWTTDQAAEGLFDRLGVTWEYVPDIAISLIDRELSLQNQARLGVTKIDQDVVEEYFLAMLEGAVFPALVAFPLPNGTYVLAGGNHRLAAARAAEIKWIDLYVLRVNDEAMRRLVTTSLNTLVGMRPDRAEIMEQAIAWMERYGRSSKLAASFYGIPDSSIRAEVRRRAATHRLAAAGVPLSTLTKATREKLAQIPNDIVLREASLLQSEVQLPERDARTFVDAIREQRTEAAQLAVVQQWRDRDDLKLRRAEVSKGRPSPTVRARADLFRVLRSAVTILDRHVSLSQMGLTNDEDYHQAFDLAQKIAARLEKLGASPR